MINIKLHIETISIILFVAIIYAIQFYTWNGAYIDTDNYMHALRTIDFMKDPSFWEQKFMQTNYPFGEISHWTHFFDIIMVLCALPFTIFEPLKEAVFHGGLLITPLFFLLTLLCLERWGKQFLSLRSRILLYLLFAFNTDLFHAFAFARPDHHAVIMYLAVLQFLCLSEYIIRKQEKFIISSAIICGLGLWLAAEGLFMYIAEITFLYSGYLFFQYDKKVLPKFCLFYALSVGICWLVNPPYQGYLFIDTGRISVLYFGAALYVWTAFIITEKINLNKIIRTVVLALCAMVFVAVIYAFGWLDSPLDERIYKIFVNRISEMQSGLRFGNMAFPMLACFCLYGLWYSTNKREEIILFSVFLLIYTVLTVYARRFTGYAVTYAAIIIVWRVNELNLNKKMFSLATVLLLLINPLSYSFDSLIFEEKTKFINFNANYLNYIRFPKGAVVSDAFISPYILWFSERPTVASPYHRNVEGLIDNHEILFSDDMDKVKSLLKKHQVRAIILPIPDEEEPDDYYLISEHNCNKLYHLIMECDNYPRWLKKMYRSKKYKLSVFFVNLEEM